MLTAECFSSPVYSIFSVREFVSLIFVTFIIHVSYIPFTGEILVKCFKYKNRLILI